MGIESIGPYSRMGIFFRSKPSELTGGQPSGLQYNEPWSTTIRLFFFNDEYLLFTQYWLGR